MKVFQTIAHKLNAISNCIAKGNTEWQAKHTEAILELVKETAPSGSGIDCGTEINFDLSTDEKLVFNTAYHHMNDDGCYDGWSNHHIIITPSLAFNFSLKITGRDRNEIKEYLHEEYREWLSSEVKEDKPSEENVSSPA